MKRVLPKISFFIMAYNDAKSVRRLLKSIYQQDYPKNKIEVIVIDDASEDNTVDIARKFPTKILTNGTHDMYRSLAMGYHAAKGDYVYQIDQDNVLRNNQFIKRMIKPLLNDPSITASFTRYYPNSKQNWITRYISYHPCQLDPLYEYFAPPVEKLFVEKKSGYFVCDYSSKKIPPYTMMLFRRTALKKSPLWKDERFFDHETLMGVISAGFTRYAYVPSAGLYHNHADSLSHFIGKRVRNLKAHYLKTNSKYKYTWFDTTTYSGIGKIVFWVIYANLFIPSLLRGIYKSIKFRDTVLLAEPIIAILTTDIILFNFLRLPEGRKFIKKSFSWLFKKPYAFR